MADELMEVSGESLARESELHGSTPIGSLIGEKLKQLRGDLLQPLQPQQHSRQAGIDSAQALRLRIGCLKYKYSEEHTQRQLY